MVGILVSELVLDRYGEDLERVATAAELKVEPIVLPMDPEVRLSDEECTRIEVAFYSLDILEGPTARSFFSSLYRAPQLSWVHLRPAGVDHPAFSRLLSQGIRLTNSAGATAEPIAQSAIAGMLSLARGFPRYAEAQRQHIWDQIDENERPDLLDQTLLVFGLGAIGSAIARIGQAVGLHVIGVRRSPWHDGDPVDELLHPDELMRLLPRTDWLVIACPLSPQTRGLFDAKTLGVLTRGAYVINVGRGPIIDEHALIEALLSGQLGGAYLDVFEEEPLPSESPLWDMPQVIVTPHNSGASQGNNRRSIEILFANLGRWGRGEPLLNEVHEAGS